MCLFVSYPSMYLFIHPCIYLSIIHPCILLSIHVSFYLFYPCIYTSIYPPMYLFIYLSIHVSIYLSMYMFFYFRFLQHPASPFICPELHHRFSPSLSLSLALSLLSLSVSFSLFLYLPLSLSVSLTFCLYFSICLSFISLSHTLSLIPRYLNAFIKIMRSLDPGCRSNRLIVSRSVQHSRSRSTFT